MRSVAEWLGSIGLGEYAQRFAEEAIEVSVLMYLTEQDLKDLGLPLGHRRRLLRAIAELEPAALTRTQRPTEMVPRDDAERRQLTVMFCDMVDSTALSARLDPEDMRQVIATYQTGIGDLIGEHQGGTRYVGDGVLAYVGYPKAHEDDAGQAER